jgi:hypothetical protein
MKGAKSDARNTMVRAMFTGLAMVLRRVFYRPLHALSASEVAAGDAAADHRSPE